MANPLSQAGQADAPAFDFVTVCHTVETDLSVAVFVISGACTVNTEVDVLPASVLKIVVVDAGSVVVRVVTRLALLTIVEVGVGRVV